MSLVVLYSQFVRFVSFWNVHSVPCLFVRVLVRLFPIQLRAYPDDICREVVRINEIISLGPALNMGPKRRGLTKGSPSKSEPGAGSAKSKVSCLLDPFLFAVLSPKF